MTGPRGGGESTRPGTDTTIRAFSVGLHAWQGPRFVSDVGPTPADLVFRDLSWRPTRRAMAIVLALLLAFWIAVVVRSIMSRQLTDALLVAALIGFGIAVCLGGYVAGVGLLRGQWAGPVELSVEPEALVLRSEGLRAVRETRIPWRDVERVNWWSVQRGRVGVLVESHRVGHGSFQFTSDQSLVDALRGRVLSNRFHNPA